MLLADSPAELSASCERIGLAIEERECTAPFESLRQPAAMSDSEEEMLERSLRDASGKRGRASPSDASEVFPLYQRFLCL